MNLEFIKSCIEEKLNENQDFIKYTYYWVRVKKDVSKNDFSTFMEYSKTYFENTGYNVYLRGDKYTYNNELHTVKDNELLVAIKEKRNKNELKKQTKRKRN